MIDTDKYEGHTPGPWKIEHFPELDAVRESYYDEDLKLIAAAPDLLAEVKRLRHALTHVGASLYLDSNDYITCDYAKLLEYCMEQIGEPDDMTGEMGVMIQERID